MAFSPRFVSEVAGVALRDSSLQLEDKNLEDFCLFLCNEKGRLKYILGWKEGSGRGKRRDKNLEQTYLP